LDLGWAAGGENGRRVAPSRMATELVERLLREVGLVLADGAPVLEHAYTASECHRLPTRDLRGALEAVGVLWEGDIIVRESSDERCVALRKRCSVLWASLERE
jgi:hypothetical protein